MQCWVPNTRWISKEVFPSCPTFRWLAKYRWAQLATYSFFVLSSGLATLGASQLLRKQGTQIILSRHAYMKRHGYNSGNKGKTNGHGRPRAYQIQGGKETCIECGQTCKEVMGTIYRNKGVKGATMKEERHGRIKRRGKQTSTWTQYKKRAGHVGL